MHIHWKIERLDENCDQNPAAGECLIEIEGAIECDGQTAGVVDASYLYADEPESSAAFMELWDLDSRTCRVFEEILAPDHGKFREPIPDLLGAFSGILCVHLIALHPQFRRRGLGREIMDAVVRNFADDRVGMVLLDAQPLQHLPHGYDHFDEEVRDLPWNSPKEDLAKLVNHFRSWGMRHLPRTRYMLGAPEDLTDALATDWYPGLLCDE